VLLTQIWFENNKLNRAIIEVDTLFKKYKKGDKIKIQKGKVIKKMN
jgi:ribosomal protein L21E